MGKKADKAYRRGYADGRESLAGPAREAAARRQQAYRQRQRDAAKAAGQDDGQQYRDYLAFLAKGYNHDAVAAADQLRRLIEDGPA